MCLMLKKHTYHNSISNSLGKFCYAFDNSTNKLAHKLKFMCTHGYTNAAYNDTSMRIIL